MPLAQCPYCNRRNGSLVKVGKKYLHYRCRKDGNHKWKEEFATADYDSKPYAVFKFTSPSRKEFIRSMKLKSTCTQKLNIIDDPESTGYTYDWIAVLNSFDSYKDAITNIRKMNTPDRINYFTAFKILVGVPE